MYDKINFLPLISSHYLNHKQESIIIECQNQESLATKLLKSFTFGHLTVLHCGFTNVATMATGPT